MKRSILVLTSTYPRWKNDTEPGFVHELARRLSVDFEVHVLAPHFDKAKAEERLDGVFVHRFRYGPPMLERLAYQGGMLSNVRQSPWVLLLLPIFLMSQFFAAFRIILRYRIKLIHAHWVIPQGLVALLLRCIFQDRVLVVTSHGADVYAMNGRVLKYLKGVVYRVADAVTVVSRAMADVVSVSVDPNKLTIAPMGVDLQETFVMTQPLEQRQGVVFVGRLVEKKGVKVLLSAFAELITCKPGILLTLVGDGPERRVLEQQVAKLNLTDHVRFMGAVPNHDIPAILNQHAIAVVPSVIAGNGDQEGLGLVSVEAMGCGCAIVASDLPAIHDVVIDQETGLMFEPGNARALKQCLAKLLDDDSLRCTIARRGNLQAKASFDWSISVDNYRRIFDQLL